MPSGFFKCSSPVEQNALQRSGRQFIYRKTEKIPVIEVDNFPMLGKLTALRFIEWVQHNPGGVISLPTGKTPEHFIRWVRFFLENWNTVRVQKILADNGIDPGTMPRMDSLYFVQMDEFYPINPNQKNSFNYYVKNYYIEGFGLDPDKALLIDCYTLGIPEHMTIDQVFPEGKVDLSLRSRHADNSLERIQKSVIEQVDQFCTDYESKIRKLGGIGFFLGGIGPDGHIAFNIRGSDFYSTTRLTPTNYETQAAAASDLGGIEIARNRLVITIGLSTITFRKDAITIIFAAGEAKAKIVAQAIESKPNNLFPASILQSLPNARFYLTHGAASRLAERRFEYFFNTEKLSHQQIEKVLINLAMSKKKRIRDLTKKDLRSNRFTKLLLERYADNYHSLQKKVEQDLITKIKDGTKGVDGKVFMHTAPHHDDIMLGYLPYIYHLVRSPKNKHFFNYMTSGFTAVTNQYVLGLLQNLSNYMETPDFERRMAENYFTTDNRVFWDRDVYHYLDGVAAHSQTLKNEAVSRRLLRDLVQLYEEESISHLKNRISELMDYFRTQYPGKKDLGHIQKLKGMIREWEADILWAHFGFDSRSVNHLRLGFYKGEMFTEEPDIERDVRPILQLLKKIKPDVVTTAFDPEGSGPDTHYKVLQAIAMALKQYQKESKKEVEIWGYRNVWYRFHPSEANVFVPVSLNSMAVLENTFHNSFGSQRDASFPSYELDGPFSRLAQKIQADQFYVMKTCLGQNFFNENEHPRIRATHGLCFVCTMHADEFYAKTTELKAKIESEDMPY